MIPLVDDQIAPDAPAAVAEEAPLTFGQQRLWLLQTLSPGVAAYHIDAAYRIDGVLDVACFAACFREIVYRHAPLRTTFALKDGQPRQFVSAAGAAEVDHVDLTTLPEAARAAAWKARQTEIGARPFDLRRGPLVRATLFQTGPATHVLSLTFHHLIADGWSFGVLFREWLTLYEAGIEGRPARLAALPMTFPEVARRERSAASEASLMPEVDRWVARLAGAPPFLDLPTDRPRLATQSFAGARLPLPMPPGLFSELGRFVQAERATVFMGLCAVFLEWLRRYTGQTDLVVGTPVAGRTEAAYEPLIGFFVNTLALRGDVSGRPTFRELLRRVRGVALDGFDHQMVPFERIVAALDPPRVPGRTPVFEVMIALQNAPMPRLEGGGLRLVPLDSARTATPFALWANFRRDADGCRLLWHFNTDLFDEATVRRMMGHYLALLAAALAAPDRPLADLSMATEAERETLRAAERGPRQPVPEGTLHAHFAAQAARTPSAVALRYEGKAVTYAVLERRSNRLARYLRRRGVRPGDRVGIALARTPALVEGVLAVLKAGAAYVPLDPAYPTQRLGFMYADSDARYLLTTTPLRDQRFPELSAETILCLDEETQAWEQEPEDPLRLAVPEGAPAYVLYTSGSTGQPKGVIGTHGAVMNRLAWMWRAHPFADGEVGVAKTALSFVDAVGELFGPMLRGVPVALMPEAVVKNPEALVAQLAAARVSRIVLVPSLLRALLDLHGETLGARLPALRLWTASGEALSDGLAARFARCVPGAVLLNLYGSSEIMADATAHRVTSGVSPVPIGRPIDNVQVYVCGADGQRVPIGVPGEVYIGGAGVALGYQGQPGRTAAAFVPDPFSGVAGARLFRTGDRGRWQADGTLAYLGRRDDQVKIRGYRVEPGEAVALLGAHPAVHEAHVVVVGHGAQGRLVAYVQPNEAGGTTAEAMAAYLRERLPAPLCPMDIVMVDAFARTPHGKLDRQALPTPDAPRPDAEATGYVPPRDDVERRLAAVWSAVLGGRRIGVNDDFFALGGHSLLAVDLFAEIERVFGRRLPLDTLFQSPTVEAQARRLRAGRAEGQGAHLVLLQPEGVAPPLFCVHNLGSTVLLYHALARRLAPERPVYGLRGGGLDGRPLPFASVEEMADAYLAEVRVVQPHGPYHLLSFCLGSRVALAMAQRLRAAGEAVGVLCFIDAINPSFPRPPQHRHGALLEAYGAHLSKLQAEGQGYAWGRARARAERLRGQARRGLYRALGRAFHAAGRPIPDALKFPYILEANRRLMQAYRPTAYPGRLTLFRSSHLADLPPDLGWGVVAKAGVAGYDLDGPHRLLDEPYVGAVARQLVACLRASEQGMAG